MAVVSGIDVTVGIGRIGIRALSCEFDGPSHLITGVRIHGLRVFPCGALAAPECRRVIAAIDLAERLELPVEWIPVSSGAKISMDSGTENLPRIFSCTIRVSSFPP
jgi:hypothetical protein